MCAAGLVGQAAGARGRRRARVRIALDVGLMGPLCAEGRRGLLTGAVGQAASTGVAIDSSTVSQVALITSASAKASSLGHLLTVIIDRQAGQAAGGEHTGQAAGALRWWASDRRAFAFVALIRPFSDRAGSIREVLARAVEQAAGASIAFG